MNTHRLKDHKGRWHPAARSSSRAGTWVQFNKNDEPARLWLPGQFDVKSVQVIV